MPAGRNRESYLARPGRTQNQSGDHCLQEGAARAQPRPLKVGYFTVLTIITERKTMTATRKYLPLPKLRSFSLN